jgi:molecular chaperone GrpE
MAEDQGTAGVADQKEPEAPAAPDYKELYLRALADLDNYRKGLEKQRVAYGKSIADSVYRRLLEPVDSVDRAVADLARLKEEAPAALQAGIGRSLDGVKALQRQLTDLLASEGVTVIDARGAEFDPAVHEALMRIPHASVPVDHVIDVLRPGYMSHGRLLRAAAVSVSAGPLAGDEAEGRTASGPGEAPDAHPRAPKKGAHENHQT